jgi:hypothetical protein
VVCASLAKSMHLQLDLLALSPILPGPSLVDHFSMSRSFAQLRSILNSFDASTALCHTSLSFALDPPPELCPFQPRNEQERFAPGARLHHIDLELRLIFMFWFL